MTYIFIILLIFFVEVSLVLAVKFFRRDFQWLITEEDECPKLDESGLKKFFEHSYDAGLGWVKKPNTSGMESGRYGPIRFTIDPRGARSNNTTEGTKEIIATFGDSYTFCRQVNDEETWQVYLGKKLDFKVLNYGVGNYGVDQALLRYESTNLPDSIKIVILGFVPETICRVQSYWKHYLEFGNTFAFKPRFILRNGKLGILPNVMQSRNDFLRLREKLPLLQENDDFYRTKFRRFQFRTPYIISFFRNTKRNGKLLTRLLIRKYARKLNKVTSEIENAPFSLIMENNIKDSHGMYSKKESRELLKSILIRFRDIAYKKGHKPLVVVMPQLIDLKMMTAKGKSPYHDFFNDLNSEMDVINLDKLFLDYNFRQLYSEDLYGGHFSKEGNEIVGNYLANRLKDVFSSQF